MWTAISEYRVNIMSFAKNENLFGNCECSNQVCNKMNYLRNFLMKNFSVARKM